jgi:hypothetical protein
MEPAALTEAYRIAQATVAGRTAGGLTVAFNTLLDPSDLTRTFPQYATVASRIIDTARREASATAGAYYLAHREAMGVSGPVDLAYADSLPPAQVMTSLLVTGPVTAKQAMSKGSTLEQAMSLALSATLGAGYRLSADAGRATIRNTTARDPNALGYARVTDGRPCAFCAMLASRGPVYKDEHTARVALDGDVYHDKCGCHPEPAYYRDQNWPGRGREFQKLWNESTKGYSGNDAINAFRRAYEGGGVPVAPKVAPKLPARPVAPNGIAGLPTIAQPSGMTAKQLLTLDARGTNPNYGQPRYDINCSQVVAAHDLRRRGYDVIATPLSTTFSRSGRNPQVILNRYTLPNGAPHGRVLGWNLSDTQVDAIANAWPDGARGWITVSWKAGGAHIFNVEKIGGAVRYLDAQTSTSNLALSTYANKANPGVWSIVRVDDLVPTDALVAGTDIIAVPKP